MIDKRYPGTKLSLTEYMYGGSNHISGGLAQADVLGIFGREGLYMANYWERAGVESLEKYIEAAFKLYRNYDGQGGRFGDTAVAAKVDDITKASIYAATDSKRKEVLTVVVINKHQTEKYQAKISIAGKTKYVRAKTFRFDASGPEIKPAEEVKIEGNVLQATVPRLSATMFVCETK
jgi:mannan endo-1,4-beta-mannosidase